MDCQSPSSYVGRWKPYRSSGACATSLAVRPPIRSASVRKRHAPESETVRACSIPNASPVYVHLPTAFYHALKKCLQDERRGLSKIHERFGKYLVEQPGGFLVRNGDTLQRL